MKFSIVTPSYNQGRFIEETLKSVAHQSGAEIQHYIIDGGSTDQTIEILENFSSPISWISEVDAGQSNAINKGFFASDGEIIGWLNSDDIYYPGTIAKVAQFFSNHPEIDVVYGKANHIDIYGVKIEDYPTEPWNQDNLLEKCFICQPATFFRRRVIELYGLIDESLEYAMDYEFWLRLAKGGACFGYLDATLAGSRLYNENKTLGARVKVHKEINKVFKKTFGVVPDRWLFNYAYAVVDDFWGVRNFHNPLQLLHFIIISLTASIVCNHAFPAIAPLKLKSRM